MQDDRRLSDIDSNVEAQHLERLNEKGGLRAHLLTMNRSQLRAYLLSWNEILDDIANPETAAATIDRYLPNYVFMGEPKVWDDEPLDRKPEDDVLHPEDSPPGGGVADSGASPPPPPDSPDVTTDDAGGDGERSGRGRPRGRAMTREQVMLKGEEFAKQQKAPRYRWQLARHIGIERPTLRIYELEMNLPIKEWLSAL